jgi:hypothetical protein
LTSINTRFCPASLETALSQYHSDAIYGVTPFTGRSRAVPGWSSAPEEKLGRQPGWNRHPVLGFWLRLWGFLGHPWDSSLGCAFPGICSSAPPAGDGLCLQLRVEASVLLNPLSTFYPNMSGNPLILGVVQVHHKWKYSKGSGGFRGWLLKHRGSG